MKQSINDMEKLTMIAKLVKEACAKRDTCMLCTFEGEKGCMFKTELGLANPEEWCIEDGYNN